MDKLVTHHYKMSRKLLFLSILSYQFHIVLGSITF